MPLSGTGRQQVPGLDRRDVGVDFAHNAQAAGHQISNLAWRDLTSIQCLHLFERKGLRCEVLCLTAAATGGLLFTVGADLRLHVRLVLGIQVLNDTTDGRVIIASGQINVDRGNARMGLYI